MYVIGGVMGKGPPIKFHKFQVMGAENLPGQLIVPHRPADELVWLTVTMSVDTLPTVTFAAQNRLSSVTAPGLLHFLSHVGRCAFTTIQNIRHTNEPATYHFDLNPSLISYASTKCPLRLHTQTFVQSFGQLEPATALDNGLRLWVRARTLQLRLDSTRLDLAPEIIRAGVWKVLQRVNISSECRVDDAAVIDTLLEVGV